MRLLLTLGFVILTLAGPALGATLKGEHVYNGEFNYNAYKRLGASTPFSGSLSVERGKDGLAIAGLPLPNGSDSDEARAFRRAKLTWQDMLVLIGKPGDPLAGASDIADILANPLEAHTLDLGDAANVLTYALFVGRDRSVLVRRYSIAEPDTHFFVDAYVYRGSLDHGTGEETATVPAVCPAIYAAWLKLSGEPRRRFEQSIIEADERGDADEIRRLCGALDETVKTAQGDERDPAGDEPDEPQQAGPRNGGDVAVQAPRGTPQVVALYGSREANFTLTAWLRGGAVVHARLEGRNGDPDACLAMVKRGNAWSRWCEVLDKIGDQRVEGAMEPRGNAATGAFTTGDGIAVKLWVNDVRDGHALVAIRFDDEPAFQARPGASRVLIFDGLRGRPAPETVTHTREDGRTRVALTIERSQGDVGGQATLSVSSDDPLGCQPLVGRLSDFWDRHCEIATKDGPRRYVGALAPFPNGKGASGALQQADGAAGDAVLVWLMDDGRGAARLVARFRQGSETPAPVVPNLRRLVLNGMNPRRIVFTCAGVAVMMRSLRGDDARRGQAVLTRFGVSDLPSGDAQLCQRIGEALAAQNLGLAALECTAGSAPCTPAPPVPVTQASLPPGAIVAMRDGAPIVWIFPEEGTKFWRLGVDYGRLCGGRNRVCDALEGVRGTVQVVSAVDDGQSLWGIARVGGGRQFVVRLLRRSSENAFSFFDGTPLMGAVGPSR